MLPIEALGLVLSDLFPELEARKELEELTEAAAESMHGRALSFDQVR